MERVREVVESGGQGERCGKECLERGLEGALK